MNYNDLLSNNCRNELIGQNMFIFDASSNPSGWDFSAQGVMTPAHIWSSPEFLMKGILGLGHHTDVKDILTMSVYLNGKKQEFNYVRHYWSPAYMDTYYRNSPDNSYKKSGLLIIRERKCITSEDVFVSELTVINDNNTDAAVDIKLQSSLDKVSPEVYLLKGKTLPGALNKTFEINCNLAVKHNVCKILLKPFEKKSFKIAALAAYDLEKTKKLTEKAFTDNNVIYKNEKYFNSWIEKNVPVLKSDNIDILKTYYYRWYLVYRNTYAPKKIIKDHFIMGNSIYESSTGSWYGCPVGLPVAMQIEETKWMKDGKICKDHIKNWAQGNGWYQGYIQYTPLAIWHLYNNHKDINLLKKIYIKLSDFTYAKYKDGNLPITEGSWLTGAEYQPSFYQYTPDPWDYRYDNELKSEVGNKVRKLYRLDEIMFTAGNIYACKKISAELGYKKESLHHKKQLDNILGIIKEKFWNEKDSMFYDIDSETGKQCSAAPCYDSFVPLMWNLISEKKYEKCLEKLFDSKSFAYEFGSVTVSKECPMYWSDNALVGPAAATKSKPHFYDCCWNGPVWPFAQTLILNALGDVAKRNHKYRQKWIDMFENYTALHFMLGDRSVPDIVEHYRPSDGTPFSTTHDYFHSSYIDLFMRYWAGISIKNDKVVFNPFTKEEFELFGVVINGKCYNLSQKKINNKLIKKIEVAD